MSNKYVQKCDCCDTKFSEIAIPIISVQHKTELADLMVAELREQDMRGYFSLLCTDELIVAFNYQYANKKEQKFSKALCEGLHSIACDYYQAQTFNADTSHQCCVDLA